MRILILKWSVSRGQNSYGYNIVSLWENGKKVFSTNGGGYDMKGTVFGSWLKENYLERIKKLSGNTGSLDDGTGYYGLSYYTKDGNSSKNYIDGKTTVRINGACGLNEMFRIAEAVELSVKYDYDADVIVVIDRKEKNHE